MFTIMNLGVKAIQPEGNFPTDRIYYIPMPTISSFSL